MGAKARERKQRRRRERVIAVSLVALGIISVPLAFVFYNIPNVFPPKTYEEIMTVKYPTTSSVVTDSGGTNYTILTPTVHFTIDSTFEAQGGYGADNPITVHSVITRANATLTDYYCCLLFTDASSPNPNVYADGWLNLVAHPNGVYTADGVLEWPTEGPTYTWLYPRAPIPPQGHRIQTTWGVGMDVIVPSGSNRMPTLTLDPISDTRGWQNAQFENRLLIIGAFSTPAVIFEVIKKSLGF